MGNPIGHSKSPRIHALFAAQTNQLLQYTAILVEPGNFPAAVEKFQLQGGKGLNITVPFKQDAWSIANRCSVRAQRAGAANTLVMEDDGSLFGDNTDGIGLIRDLVNNLGATIKGRRVVLLGAGGAARGIVEPLLGQRPKLLVVANRTAEKAIDLARDFCDLGIIEGSDFSALQNQKFNVVINATAAGLTGATPALPSGMLANKAWCYDLMYGDRSTPFVRWAKQQGATHAVDGLGMLVEQAAESFFVWRNVRPDTAKVIATLNEERGQAAQRPA